MWESGAQTTVTSIDHIRKHNKIREVTETMKITIHMEMKAYEEKVVSNEIQNM